MTTLSTRTFDTLVIDYAGVLTNPIWEVVQAFADRYDYPVTELVGALGRAAEKIGANPFEAMETGAISEAEMVAQVLPELPVEAQDALGDKSFGEIWFEGFRVNQEIVETVLAYRAQGLRVILMTNNVREWEPLWHAQFDMDAMFDAVVDSSREGLRKPDPELFLRMLGRYQLDPSRCVFLDDVAENCETARSLGLTAVQFLGNSQARTTLSELLGTP
jgi:putative hydrolase of the HAD superfamily